MTMFNTVPEGKLFAVFDSPLETAANLHNCSPVTFDNNGSLRNYLKAAGFVNIFTKHYAPLLASKDLFGIYVISVRSEAPSFLGGYSHRNIFYDVPKNVIEAARANKLIIVIDNQSEGESLNFGHFDGFKAIHTAMAELALPQFSVLLINGDAMLYEKYEQWRHEHWVSPMFHHVCFTVWTWIFHASSNGQPRIPATPLILDALKNNSKSFNSLNRSPRPHRLEHLYYLITNDLLKQGLVSGHWCRDTSASPAELQYRPLLTDVQKETYSKTLWDNLPVEADGPWIEDNPDDSDQHIFNHNIYKNSLVTVVTERHFVDRGVFLTEKIFKPIAAGHPFILIGSYKMLETLRKFGYRTDFDMFDDSYDNISSNTDRLAAVHEQLLRWTSLTREQQEASVRRSMDAIIHNQELFRKKDYVTESYNSLHKVITYIKESKAANYEPNTPFKQQF